MTKRMTIAALALCGVFLSTYLSLYKLGYLGAIVCGTGGCGVRPVWIAAGFGALAGIWIIVALVRRVGARRSGSKRRRAGGKRKPGVPAKAKPAPQRKAAARAKA